MLIGCLNLLNIAVPRHKRGIAESNVGKVTMLAERPHHLSALGLTPNTVIPGTMNPSTMPPKTVKCGMVSFMDISVLSNNSPGGFIKLRA